MLVAALGTISNGLERTLGLLEIRGRINTVGYHPPFPHNELVYLPYIAVATNPGQTRR